MNAAQQAAIERARARGQGSTTGGAYDFTEEEERDFTEAQRAALERARARLGQSGLSDTDTRGKVRFAADFAGGIVGAVPKALGGVVSLGSLVKGVNVVADPVAEALMDAGEWVDDTLLSDYQKNINAEMAQAIANSARELGPDASVGDHLKNIGSQTGAAAKFVAQNPSQAAMLAGQAIPYLFGGGYLARGAQATVRGTQALVGAKATGLGKGTAGAVGEGLMAGGAITGDVVGQLRDEGITEYTSDRLVGIPAGAATALIGRLGAKLGGGLDADTGIANKLSGEAVDLMTDAPKRGLFRRVGVGAATEGTEEFFQSGSEEAFTNLGVGDPLSQDVGSSAVLGASAGMGVGGVSGGLQRSSNSQTTLSADLTQEELDLQAAQLAEAEKAKDLEAEAVRQQGLTRMTAAKSFMPFSKFKSERDARRNADVLNPQTETGQAYVEYKLTANKYPANEKEEKALVKKFLKEFIPQDDGEVAIDEFNQALDQHAAAVASGAVTPTMNDKPKPAPAPEAEVAAPVEQTQAQDTQEEAAPAKAPKPESAKVAQARAYAEEVLGPEWETTGGLSQEFAERKGFYKKGKDGKTTWQRSVDREAAALQETTTPEVDATTEEAPVNALLDSESSSNQDLDQQSETSATSTLPTVLGGFLEEGHKGKALTENQASVATVLRDAFLSNEEDTIQQADGTLNPTIIAEKAGIKNRQAARRAIQSLQKKIADAFGVSVYVVKQRLNETNITSTEAFDQNAPTQELDTAELGEGMGTSASVGQGAYTEVAEEDQAWTQERTNEPDQYENKRQEIADNSRVSLNAQMIQQYGNEAIAQWRGLVSDGAIDIKDISKKDLVEWVAAVAENREGQITDEQLGKDQREIERRYATEAIDNEGLGASSAEITEGGDTVEQVGTEDTGPPPEGNPDDFTAGEAKTAKVETKPKKKITKPPRKYGISGEVIEPDSKQAEKRQALADVLEALTGKRDSWKVKIYADVSELIAARLKGEVTGFEDNGIPVGAYAFTQDDKSGVPVTYIILDRMPVGSERAVFVHEVGGHMGIDNILSLDEQANVADQIRAWAAKGDNSLESIVSNRVMGRLAKAAEVVPEIVTLAELKNSETIAYFLEEATFAGVEPTVNSAVGRLVRKLYAMFKKALRKINMNPETLTPKDIVDLGWGAARFSLSTRKHGTAADFTRFDHTYMGRGEGNQAYGWGSYLAERFGIARWYLRTDEERKTSTMKDDPVDFGVRPPQSIGFKELSTELQNRIKKPNFPSGQLQLDIFDAPRPPSTVGALSLKMVNQNFDDAALTVLYITENYQKRQYEVDAVLTEDDKKSDVFVSELEALKEKLIEDRKRFDEETTVEGTMMHVDTTVSDSELLPWSEPVPRGAKLRASLTNLFNGLDPEITARVLITSLGVMPPQKRATELSNLQKRARQLPNLLTMQGSSTGKELLPPLIEDVLDFVDGKAIYAALYAFDKGNQNALVPYLSEETLQRPEFVTVEDIDFNFDPPLELHQSDKVVSMLLDDAGIKGVIYPDAGTLGAKVDAVGMANNVVVFNDENLFVVGRTSGSNVGNKKSKIAEIRFGINQDWNEHTFGTGGKKAWSITKEAMKKAANSVSFLHDIVRKNRDTMPAIGRWYDAMLKAEAIRNEIRMGFEDIAVRARDLKEDRLALVNDFLGKSTFYQKWGYDPAIKGRKVKVDPIMAKAFERLNDNEQQLVKDVFAHGEKMRARKKAIAKALGVEGKFFTDAAIEGPYAPLKRFGNYVAELKSAELIAAEELLGEKDTKINRKRVDDLKSDPDNYIISFFDTVAAAEQFTEANRSKFAEASTTEREPDTDQGRISNPQAYEKVIGALKAGPNDKFDSDAKAAFVKMVQDLYFQSLDERSARMSGARRLNRAGYDKNMMRAFLSHARSEASLISQMEMGAEINTALAEARNEVKPRPGGVRDPERQRVYNVIARHYRDGLVQGEQWYSAMEDRLAAANSVYMLTSSLGYHITNATQPMMVTVPRLAGDFNSYTGAWSALFRGYKVALKATRMSSSMQTRIELDNVPQQYRKLLENLQLRQLLDVGMEEDLAEFDRFDTGFGTLDAATGQLGKITHKLYQVARFVEAQNRISAAVAAYDMAQRNPSATKMSPQDYAAAVVEDTQGNFSRLDAPMLLKSLPKITVQYRKYQLLMAWHYSKAFKQAGWGSPEEKAAGRRILSYSIAHAAMGAGATGVPLLSTAFWLTTFLGDEDEPDDMERWIKRNVDDGKLGDALSRGVFSTLGVDLSTKLNQSKIFHPLPYVDYQTGESGAKDIFFNALAGPTGTTGVNFYRAHEYFTKGDVMKGLEYSVPKGLRSVMETYRLATEGYTLRNGDLVVDPRELDAFSLLVNAMGLPATEIQKVKWTRGQQYELEQYFSKESGKLRKAYVEARDDRDRARQQELRQEWRDLQDAKDRVRPFFNNERGTLRRQSVSDLMKAPRRQSKREQKYRKQLTGN